MKKLFLFLLSVIIFSCQETTCKGVEFIDGLSYKNGKLYTGKCITHSGNGTLRSIQSYKKGFDHGKWTFYHDNQELSTIGEFRMGIKVGEWKYFHENGVLYFHQFFDEKGNEVGVWKEFDKVGNLVKTYKKS